MRPELLSLIAFLSGMAVMWLLIRLFGPFRLGGTVTITSATCVAGSRQVVVNGTVSLGTGTTLMGLSAFVYDDPGAMADAQPPTGFQQFPAATSFSLTVNIPSTNTGPDCVAVWAMVSGCTAGATSQPFGPCGTTGTTHSP